MPRKEVLRLLYPTPDPFSSKTGQLSRLGSGCLARLRCCPASWPASPSCSEAHERSEGKIGAFGAFAVAWLEARGSPSQWSIFVWHSLERLRRFGAGLEKHLCGAVFVGKTAVSSHASAPTHRLPAVCSPFVVMTQVVCAEQFSATLVDENASQSQQRVCPEPYSPIQRARRHLKILR